jgi:hypothetical protein
LYRMQISSKWNYASPVNTARRHSIIKRNTSSEFLHLPSIRPMLNGIA